MKACRSISLATWTLVAMSAVATACGTADSAPDATSEVRAPVGVSDAKNVPPTIVGVGIEPGREIVTGTPVVLHPDATDPDGDGIRYRYEWTVNGRERREEGPLLDTERLERGDVIRVRVVASDGDDESATELPPIVVVNSPPRIVSRPPTRLDEGVFRYRVEATDPDGDGRVEYRLEGAPEGMEIDADSGVVTWTPGPDQTGVHQATVVAADPHDGVDQQVFEVRVPGSDAVPADLAP